MLSRLALATGPPDGVYTVRDAIERSELPVVDPSVYHERDQIIVKLPNVRAPTSRRCRRS